MLICLFSFVTLPVIDWHPDIRVVDGRRQSEQAEKGVRQRGKWCLAHPVVQNHAHARVREGNQELQDQNWQQGLDGVQRGQRAVPDLKSR